VIRRLVNSWPLPTMAQSPVRVISLRFGFGVRTSGYDHIVFLFFSNRLGCAGSLLVSLVATIVLVLIFRLL
jgi:hypothetical protein